MTMTSQPFDLFQQTPKLDHALLSTLAIRLEMQGRHPKFRQMMHEYLAAMQIDSTQTVLDLGCGTGIAAREIAARSSFAGQAIGIDLSDYFIETARRLASEEGVDDHVEFRTGDILSLDLPAAYFDAVVAHGLVSHMNDPLSVVQEMARLVMSGGTLTIFDNDYASLTFGYSDWTQRQTYDELIPRSLVAQPHAMRQMPRLFKAVGLEIVQHFSYAVAEVGQASYWMSTVESYRELLPVAGIMSVAEANAWCDARIQESAAGVFFGSSNFHSYVARKP